MEDCFREIILTNIETLTEWTDYEKLKNECVDTNLLSATTIQEIEVRLLSIYIMTECCVNHFDFK